MVVPFHWGCFELLATVMLGSPDATEQIDKRLLYKAVERLTPESYRRPQLDYGKPCPLTTVVDNEGLFDDYSWWIYAGDEMLVCNPSPRAITEVKKLIRDRILSSTFVFNPKTSPTERNFHREIFRMLPYDIVHMIASMLPLVAVLSLLRASHAVNAVLQNGAAFWRQSIFVFMPWLTELRELMADEPGLLDNRDVKKVLLWLDMETTPRRWMKGPFMPVANRRRAWAACEQLVDACNECVNDGGEEAIRRSTQQELPTPRGNIRDSVELV
jgi:hypothetical protein